MNEYTRNSDGELVYGNTARISSDALNLQKTMIHESGHLLGLGHFKEGNKTSTTSDNPMAYPNPYRGFFLRGFGDQRSGNFNGNQGRTIVNAINDNRLNVHGKTERSTRSAIPARNPSTWQKVKNWFRF